MATVTKDFKIKYGLVVEGTTATVNNFSILTKSTADQEYIVGLIGGTATSANTANTVVKRDASGNFAAGTITAALTGNVTGNASTATTLATARTIAGQSFDGSANISIAPTDLTGVTATAAELNILDGATLSTAELNFVDGVTSAIQTQLDAKATGSDLTTHTGATIAHGATGAVVGTTNTQTLTNKTLTSPVINTPTGITKTDVGLDNVDNTRDTLKPISTATQNALDLKAPLASPALTGTPTAPTAAANTDTTQVATTAFVKTAVANLVDSAPAVLDTLNELAAAIGDNPNYATDLAASVGLKAPIASPTFTGTVTIPAGASISGFAPLASPDLTGVPTAPTAAANTNTTQVATTAFAKAEADAAEAAAIAYADALTTADVAENTNLYYTAARAKAEAATLLANATKTNITITKDGSDNLTITAENGVADSNTDQLTEGTTNLYHTSARAKTAAAELLTGATLSNITITGSGSGLVITAENGVADSTTTNLAEGTNLYFTDARARTAVDGTARSFTTVEISSLAKQVAATLVVATASASNVVYAFPKATHRSAEFLVKTSYGAHTEISKVLLTLDTSDNIAITEYGTIGTNGASMTISAGISGANVQLLVTTANNNSTVTVMGTLLV
jgi:hypothetical protein